MVLFQLTVASSGAIGGFEHIKNKINYYDKIQQKNVQIPVEIYCPRIKNNGHLVMIANGANVAAKEYSSLSEKLSTRGYFTAIADFQSFMPSFNRSVIQPNMDVLHTLLKELINAKNNEHPNPHKINFKDVIILGHSYGGFLAIGDGADKKVVRNYSNIIENVQNFFPDEKEKFLKAIGSIKNSSQTSSNFFIDEKEQFWDEYVKGAIVFESWMESRLLVPKNNKFLVIAGSYLYKKILDLQHSFLTKEEQSEIGFYVFYNANHFLVNNFYGPKQVSPGSIPILGQGNFSTTFEQWQRGQDMFVQMLDYEIQTRLEQSKNQSEKLQEKFLAELSENKFIEKI